MHRPDPGTDIDEALSAPSDLVRADRPTVSARSHLAASLFDLDVPANRAKLAIVTELTKLAELAGSPAEKPRPG